MNKVEYSFVVPVFNEKNNILPFILEIQRVFIEISNNYEILFIDDNSPDGTARTVNELSVKYNNVKLVQHGTREGLGAAIMFGYRNAKGNIIIGMDVDLSQSPIYLKSMLAKLNNEDCDMIIGSRYLKNSGFKNKSFIRKIGSIFFNKLTSYLLGIKLTDTSHTFRLFKKEILAEISKNISEKSHPSFMIEFTYWANKKYKICETPMIFIERNEDQGESKLDIKSGIWNFIKIIIKLFFYR